MVSSNPAQMSSGTIIGMPSGTTGFTTKITTSSSSGSGLPPPSGYSTYDYSTKTYTDTSGNKFSYPNPPSGTQVTIGSPFVPSYSGGGGGGGGGTSTPAQPTSNLGVITVAPSGFIPASTPAPTSAYSLSSGLSPSAQTVIPFGFGYINPITQQSVQTTPSKTYQTQSVVSNYNPSDFQGNRIYGSSNLFENIGTAFGTMWEERKHILTEPEKTFSGFSVFNKDITRSPVEPYGTRTPTASARDYFYEQNKMTSTTNVPAAVSSGVQSAFTTGLLFASPPVGFGIMIGKGVTEYTQGIGILSGSRGYTPESLQEGKGLITSGMLNVGMGLVGYNLYVGGLSKQFIAEDVASVLKEKPTLSVSNIGKEGNIYTEAVTYSQKNPLGSAETIGAVRYEVTGARYNILEGQSTTVARVNEFFTGNPVIVSGQQSISGSGFMLPQSGGATPSFSKLTSTETATAYFTPKTNFFTGEVAGFKGKIEVFKGGEQITDFYGGIAKQKGRFGLSLSGKTSEAGIDYTQIQGGIVNPKFSYKFPIEDIRISRITETPSATEFIPFENLGLRANPSSPSSLLSFQATTQGTASSIARTLGTNAPAITTSAPFGIVSGKQTTSQITQQGFSIPSMSSAVTTKQDVFNVIIPKTTTKQITSQRTKQAFNIPSMTSTILLSPTKQDFFQVPIQNQPQITSQGQMFKQINIQPPGITTQNVPFNFNPTTIPPITKFPKFDLSGGIGNREFGARQRTKFTPDFAALVKGTKGKELKGTLTGLESRGIPKGFTWAFSIGKMFKRKN